MPKIIDSIKSVDTFLKTCHPSKIAIVTSKQLSLKLSWAIKELNMPKSNIVLIPDGEQAKEWNELEIMLKKFRKMNLDRESIVIALGGGTVGDITGFAASIYLRGIRYIQVPTTFLAQVDSAHGGKTGINFDGSKNQIGDVYMPEAIIMDKRFLSSLTEEQMIDGLGEIIKVGLVKDASILALLNEHTIKSLSRSADLQKVIDKSIKAKEYFVNIDAKNSDLRELLNFGHTIAHAIELKYNVSHGRAVMLGMLKELEIAEALGLTPASIRQNLLALLDRLGIKIDFDKKADWQSILHDKKIVGNEIIFSVIEKEGKARLMMLDLNTLRKHL